MVCTLNLTPEIPGLTERKEEKEKLELTVSNLQQCLAANDSSLAKGLALLHEKLEVSQAGAQREPCACRHKGWERWLVGRAHH